VLGGGEQGDGAGRWRAGQSRAGVIDIGNPSGPWTAHLQSSSVRLGHCLSSIGQIGRLIA
jgi:hypothetical protein